MEGDRPRSAQRPQHGEEGGRPPAGSTACPEAPPPPARSDERRARREAARCSPSGASPPFRCSSSAALLPGAGGTFLALASWTSARSSRAPSSGSYLAVGAFLYPLALAPPFANLLWVMVIQLLLGGISAGPAKPRASTPSGAGRICASGAASGWAHRPLAAADDVPQRARSPGCCAGSGRRWARTSSAPTTWSSPDRWTSSPSRTTWRSRPEPTSRRAGRGRSCTSAPCASRAAARSACGRASPTT